MKPRSVLRLLAATATTGFVLLLSASPVWAANRDDGDASGPGLSVVQTVLIFVVTPAALFGVIALLAVAPSLARRPRYRPGLSWWAEPVWFHGPAGADAEAAAAGAAPDRSAAAPTTDGGGTSARW